MTSSNNYLKKFKTVIFASGNGTNAENLINCSLYETIPLEIALVICNNPKAAVINIAKKYGIPIIILNHRTFRDYKQFEETILVLCSDQKIEVALMAGWDRIFRTNLVFNYFGNKILNIHPGDPDHFVGLNCIEKTLLAGFDRIKIIVHVATLMVDKGPIIQSVERLITKEDTLETLTKRVHQAEYTLYPKAINIAAEFVWI